MSQYFYSKNILGIFFLILIDQITKLLISPRDFFVGPIHLHLVKNFGLVFGLDFGVWNMLILGMALLIFFWLIFRDDSFKKNIGFTFILAGALSNILDRVVLGYVRDFIDLQLAFTFNVADMLIAVGIISLFWASNQDHIGETTQKNV